MLDTKMAFTRTEVIRITEITAQQLGVTASHSFIEKIIDWWSNNPIPSTGETEPIPTVESNNTINKVDDVAIEKLAREHFKFQDGPDHSWDAMVNQKVGGFIVGYKEAQNSLSQPIEENDYGSLNGCPFVYCDKTPKCEGECRYANDPHEVSKVKCDLCAKEWVAVRKEGLIELECPNCGNMVHFENV